MLACGREDTYERLVVAKVNRRERTKNILGALGGVAGFTRTFYSEHRSTSVIREASLPDTRASQINAYEAN